MPILFFEKILSMIKGLWVGTSPLGNYAYGGHNSLSAYKLRRQYAINIQSMKTSLRTRNICRNS